MRLITIGLLLSLIFIGCGYKADPIYVDGDKTEQKGEKQ
jgi:hypothetical protein